MDTYADALSELIGTFDLKGAALIGFSANDDDIACYIGHHDTKKMTKAALI